MVHPRFPTWFEANTVDQTHICCSSAEEWESAWLSPRFGALRRRKASSHFKDIAQFVGGALFPFGFRLFQNGGIPQLERRTLSFREEILLIPSPRMHLRAEEPFRVRLHLSSTEVARVRSRYWRPASRAPGIVASGDIGELLDPPSQIVWFGSGQSETAEKLARTLLDSALPWFGVFHEPLKLKSRIYTRNLPLVDVCTALELLLAGFDPFEGRRFLQSRVSGQLDARRRVDDPEGYDLERDRLGPIAEYYRLR